MEKFMRHGKTFNIIISLFVVLGIFVNSSFAAVCLCGQACSHGLQQQNNIRPNLLFHLQCSGTQCESCNLEKGGTLKAANVFTKNHNVNDPDATIALSVHITYPSTYHNPEGFGPFYIVENFSGFPVYLQNLCLRF